MTHTITVLLDQKAVCVSPVSFELVEERIPTYDAMMIQLRAANATISELRAQLAQVTERCNDMFSVTESMQCDLVNKHDAYHMIKAKLERYEAAKKDRRKKQNKEL